MSQNKILSDKKNKNFNFFFTVEYAIDRNIVCMNMTLKGIEFFLEILRKFSKDHAVVIHKYDLTMDPPNKNYIAVSEIFIQYESIATEDLVVNLVSSEDKLYIFSSQKGIDELMDSLMCLKDSLEHDRPEDISLMIEEWGGTWLLNQKIIEGSEVICHLRLYGILG